MKKLLSIFIALIAIVALVTPAAASTYATIEYAAISGHNVIIGGSVPCPYLWDVETVVNSWKIKIDITQAENPYAGVCPPDADPVPFGEFVNVPLSRAKDVYVNGVLIGTMYP